jgi:hypothetical protein
VARLQGDVDCNGVVDAVDSLKILRWIVLLNVSQEPGCPVIGSAIPYIWGDVDCQTGVTAVDALKILRWIVLLGYSQQDPCAEIGTLIVQ